MKHIVIFNGPPNSGKDFAADYCKEQMIASRHIAYHKEFKEKLFRLMLEVYDIDRGIFFALYNDRVLKETVTPLLEGLSPRQAMIKVSEELMKPIYGKAYFGKSAARTLQDGATFFSDGGFVEEVFPVAKLSDSVTIVRLTRPGCSFKGDSRNYLDKDQISDVDFLDIHNDSDVDDFKNQLDLFLYEWKIKHGYN